MYVRVVVYSKRAADLSGPVTGLSSVEVELPSSSGLGLRPFTAATRVRIPLGVLWKHGFHFLYGPVAQLVSAPPCHGGGREFKSRQGRNMDGGSPLRWGPAVCRLRGLRDGYGGRVYAVIRFSGPALCRLPRSVMIVHGRRYMPDAPGRCLGYAPDGARKMASYMLVCRFIGACVEYRLVQGTRREAIHSTALWRSWLARRPVTAEVASSSLVRVAEEGFAPFLPR